MVSDQDIVRNALLQHKAIVDYSQDAFASFRSEFHPALPAHPSSSKDRPSVPARGVEHTVPCVLHGSSDHQGRPETEQERLARASAQTAREMNSYFNCALGVQEALAKIGMRNFYGCGDAWDMGRVLQQSGRFKVIPESEARRGDIGVQAWSKSTIQAYFHKYHGRNLGDIFVVQDNERGRISQSNDHVQSFNPRDPNYNPNQRYFLRFV